MYEYIHEKRLFDKWGRWCDDQNDILWFLGVNHFGYRKRSALDRIGEGGMTSGPVRYGTESVRRDDSEMRLLSSFMEAWQKQMPNVHAALMARHRDVWTTRKMGLAPGNFKAGSDSELAWAVVGDATYQGVGRFYELCEAGYRIVRINQADTRLAA